MKFVFFLIFILSLPVQALEVTAFTDKKEVAINETFTITIKIQSKGTDLNNIDIPQTVKFQNFYLLNQWTERQSSTEIINGNITSSNSILKKYSLQPVKQGTFKINLFSIKVNNKKFNLNPIVITVLKERKQKSNPPSRSFPFFNTPPGSPFQIPNSLFNLIDPFVKETPFDETSKFKIEVSKKTVYKSEGLRVNWLILESSGSLSSNIEKFSELKGFWKEELTKIKPGQFIGNQIIDKVLYRKTLLQSLWLFPLQTGQLIIDPLVIRINKRNGFFTQSKNKAFPKQNIIVKPLPSVGLDSSFTGAVSSVFNVSSEIKEKFAVVNQPLSYKVIFKGQGHPRFINLPELKFPPNVQTYKPAEKSKFFDSGKYEKEFEILIVPTKIGFLNIPSFKFSSFDPKTKRYVAHYTTPFSIPIRKGDSSEEERETFFSENTKDNTQSRKSLILEPLNLPYWPHFINHKFLKFFWIGFFSILLMCFGLLFLKNLIFRNQNSFKKQIKQKLSNIQILIDDNNWRKACRQMIQLNYSLIYKGQIKSSSSDWKKALDNLPPSLHKKYAPQFEKLFKNLENLSFSGKQISETEALNKAKELLTYNQQLIQSFINKL